jgi:hypothetical protein
VTEQARPTGWLGRVAELWLNLPGVQLQVAAVLLAAAGPWWSPGGGDAKR